MNRTCLCGRLTSKPELRYTTNGIAFTRFNLAVNSGYGDNQKTDFINVIVWRKQAENVCKYLDKGSLVAIEGRIQTGNYDDKEGNKRYSFDVVADNVQFLESKKQDGQVSPRDFEDKKDHEIVQDVMNDPFAEFGDSIQVDELD